MKSKITKSVPNPSNPSEVLKHYIEHLKRWFHIFYRDTLLDLSGKKRSNMYAELLKLKNQGKGKIAFILASGPSINKLDASKVKSFCNEKSADIFCVNYLINDFLKKNRKTRDQSWNKCRILLPGSGGPRLTSLNART